RLHQRRLVLLADDVHAEFDALVADEYGWTRDEFADFVLALSTERAIQRVLGVARANLTHSCLRPPFDPLPDRPIPALTPDLKVDRANSVPEKTLSHFLTASSPSPPLLRAACRSPCRRCRSREPCRRSGICRARARPRSPCRSGRCASRRFR